jgi:hypothetical protein
VRNGNQNESSVLRLFANVRVKSLRIGSRGELWRLVFVLAKQFGLDGEMIRERKIGAAKVAPLATIRNLQARIFYATHDGNAAEVLRLKKELEKLK